MSVDLHAGADQTKVSASTTGADRHGPRGLRALLPIALVVLSMGCSEGAKDGGPTARSSGTPPRPEIESFTIDPNEAQDLVASSGVGVAFGPNSLGLANGDPPSNSATVELAKYLHEQDPLPTDMPGGFAGQMPTGESVALISYGVMGITITDSSGAPLNLVNEAQATLTIPSVSSSPPAEAPLWRLNETTSIWELEGDASYDGDDFVGTVLHFSKWNVDGMCNQACIEGIVEVDGSPGIGIEVFAQTIESSCEWFTPGSQSGASSLTGNDGRFVLDNLPGPATVRIWAEHDGKRVERTVLIPEAGTDCVDGDTLVFVTTQPDQQWMTGTADGASFNATEFESWLNTSATPPFMVLHGIDGERDIGLTVPTSDFVGTCVFEDGGDCSALYQTSVTDMYSTGHNNWEPVGTLTITITSNDGQWVDGTFSFTVHKYMTEPSPTVSASGQFHMKHPNNP